METALNPITVQTVVNAPIEKVWKVWTEPEHIMRWNAASDDWHTPKSENDLRVGGKFNATMAAKDGSFSFEFGGEYTEVEQHALIAYVLGDGRKVKVVFDSDGDQTTVTETFDPEGTNPVEMQRNGWQAIIDNFKKYTESLNL